MTALERINMMQTNPAAYLKFAESEAAKLDARVKAVHDSHGCDIWETWEEKNVRLIEGGRADITFDGCRKCGVKLSR